MEEPYKMIRFNILKATWWFIFLILLFTVSSAHARYAGFWRNAFDSKASWLETHTEEQYFHGAEHMVLSQIATSMCSLSLAAMQLVVIHNDAMDNALNEMITGYGAPRLIPAAPTITRVEPSEEGLNVFFEYNAGHSSRIRSFSLYYFENGMEGPRFVSLYSYKGYDDHDPDLPILDPDPSTSGAGFYAMTTTKGLNPTERAPDQWWALIFSGEISESVYQQYLVRRSFGWTSDYSAPFIYNADPMPETDGVDAIAIKPHTGDIFVSRPATTDIHYIKNCDETLAVPRQFVSTGFITPGQKGLAIDTYGNLYADNAASDGQYGGRLFKFDINGSRSFTGTVNYFSQLLMYANPVSVTSMVMGPDMRLYVYDALAREVKKVPVNEAWDPYRRVGQPFYRYNNQSSSNVIDMDVKRDISSPGFLYLLDGDGIRGMPMDLPSVITGMGFDYINLD